MSFEVHDEGVVIRVHVRPKARRTEVVGVGSEYVKIRVAAPPTKGQANAALIALLADILQVPKRDVVLLRGQRTRYKRVLVRGLSLEDVRARLM